MFYSEAILSKKGPLAKVWLAAHWERKLTKNQFLQTNLHNSVDAIMGTDQAPMALRLSGQLLLGVAKIYSRKTRYLLEDCNEALVKIKVAFRSDANNGDNNLLILDGNTVDLGTDQTNTAAFNAITAPDAMTQFDLLLPAHAIDMNGWGLNPKLNNSTGLRDITLDEGNDDLLFSMAGNNHTMDHGRRNLDIEVGRNQMNRIGGGGYSIMDFDLAGPDDALDLDMFGDDVAAAADPDFWKRSHRRDDFEVEVGRDAAVTRRSPSVDPFGMLAAGEKPGLLHLGEGSEDGRAPNIQGPAHEQLGFDDFVPAQTEARAPVNFEIAEGNEAGHEHQTSIKKRKLIVDNETEMAQDYAENDLMAEGLLTTHEMLPRSRKLLRLQQIEQDVAHGGLAGYLLDFTAGPRVMGGALVPELASMFSRNLQIAQEAPELRQETVTEAQREASAWQPDRVESWVDDMPGFNINRTTPPPIDTFDGFQLDAPRRDVGEVDNGEGSSNSLPKPVQPSLFQDLEDANSPAATSTKQLLGVVFSTSAVQAMRLVQQGIESKRDSDTSQNTRTTRNASVATASSSLNKDNTARVRFSELMAGPNNTQQKRSRADAAKLFFELLVLSTKDVVKVEQEESFGDISVGGSPWLETLVEADTAKV